MWNNIGEITSAQAALAADAMDDASVEALDDAKKVIYKPKNGVVGMEFRFRTDGTEDDQNILQGYSAAGVDHYTWTSLFTITQGTQDSTNEHFCETISSISYAWLSPIIPVNPATDYIARLSMVTHGYDRFLFIVTTLGTTTVYIDVREH